MIEITHSFICSDPTCPGRVDYTFPYVEGSGIPNIILPQRWVRLPDGRLFCDLHKITITIEDQ